MANRSSLQEIEIIRSYLPEWDLVPYPSMFKAPILQTFDSKGSPTQHIYHFNSQTRNIVMKDAILTRLFIGTLTVFAFE